MAFENAVHSENQNDVEPCLTKQAAYEAAIPTATAAASTSSGLLSTVASRGREVMNGNTLNDGFEDIVGASRALREVLDLVRTVAPTSSTALIEGETGTGKELIARAIHKHSARRDHRFVTLNCAAIAFTGAVARKVGRFEAADCGTLFLDEIADIPLELQPKLLRVLQEGEFERLGSTQTRRANVRLVAATNKDLAKQVGQNQFRRDLYYRLNVFPIPVPSLRERRGDIPLLARHFVRIYAERMNKQIEEIPTKVMEELVGHSWPGNVRELQNFIERSVILTAGNTLRPPLEGMQQTAEIESPELTTMEEVERHHIRKTLKHTRWVVAGVNGAAARLGIKRTTLYFRMKKLGIVRCNDAELS